MNLGSKIPVPEVDELRLARIERGVLDKVSQLDSTASSTRARWTRIAVGAVAVAGVVLAIALNLLGAQTPVTPSLESSPVATQLSTGPGQNDRLVLGDAIVDVEENTQILVQRFSDGRTLILLEIGSVHCEVEPRDARPVFQVRAGDVEVTVVGTAFDVKREETVDVSVEHGIVSVATSHETLRLHSGESWQGSPEANHTVASILAKKANPPKTEANHQSRASTEPGMNDAHDRHPRNDKSQQGKSQQGKSQQGKSQQGKSQQGKTVTLGEVLGTANPIRPVVQPSHGAKARELLAVATSNPSKAVVALEALGAKSTGHEASFALYSRAYLLFFKLGKNADVIRGAKQYARRFPQGREAEDMLWLRVRASCAAANYSSSCREAAHTYRRRYPQGVFQGLASRIIRSQKTE